MANNSTIFVGTLGQGVWRSTDGGDNWLRAREGINNESAVRALAVHPKDSSVILCRYGHGNLPHREHGRHLGEARLAHEPDSHLDPGH